MLCVIETLTWQEFNSRNAAVMLRAPKEKKKIPTSTVSDNERKGSNAIEKSDL